MRAITPTVALTVAAAAVFQARFGEVSLGTAIVAVGIVAVSMVVDRIRGLTVTPGQEDA